MKRSPFLTLPEDFEGRHNYGSRAFLTFYFDDPVDCKVASEFFGAGLKKEPSSRKLMGLIRDVGKQGK